MTFSKTLCGGSALAVLMLAAAVPAQAQQTTATVRGTIVSETGAAIPGATVVVTHVPTGTDQTIVANEAGGFDARGLRVGGPFRITASAPGYGTRTVEDIFLDVGDAQRLTLTLASGDQVEDIIVTATRGALNSQLANVGSRTTLQREDIDAVVSVRRDIRDIGRRDPLASLDFVNRGTGPSGGLYIAGSAPRSNRITIDGVRSQDSFGLNTGGLSTNRGPVSLEALEQLSVQAVPFDVEDGDFTGGALNLILRSGSNDFRGSVFYNYRTTDLAGDTVPNVGFTNNDILQAPLTGTREVINTIDEDNYGGFISGPIWRDRIFFAASYEKYESFDTTGTGPLGAGFANTFNRIPGISTGAGASQADIDRVLANWAGYAASARLTPGTVDLSQPIIDEKYSLKLDWNIMDGQRLSATYRHAESQVSRRGPSTTNISLNSNWYTQPEVEDNYSVQLNSRWTPSFSTEARVSFREYARDQLPPQGQGFANISICTDATSVGATFSCTGGTPALNFGPDQFRQANVLRTEETAGSFIGTFSGFEGHSIKAGYQYRNVDIFNLFVQQAAGVYYFDSVADFAAGRANQLSFGNAFSGVATDAAAELDYAIHTLLVQDTWDVNEALTLNYGLRWDTYASDVKPTLNANFVNRYGFNNQTTYDGIDILMPRVSARYNAETFELSGGFGLVSGGVPDVFLGNSYGATTGALTNSFAIRRQADGSFFDASSSTVISATQGAALLNLDRTNASFINTASATALAILANDSATRRNAFTNSLAPGFEIPSDWKTNLSFKTTVAGFDLGIDAVITRSETNVGFRDIRARPLTVNGIRQVTPDGRLRYDGLQIAGATPEAVNANRAAQGLPVSTNPDLANLGLFGDIQAYNPDQKAWSRTIAFSAGREWGGLNAFVSYALQDASQYGGISEFGTTAGGNGTSGNYYADQSFDVDPNAPARGDANNLIERAAKLNISYKAEVFPGWVSRFTLFGERRTGRPISFLMTDPAGNRNPTFGVSRDDALAYIPNLSSPDAANPLRFVDSNGVTVFFDSQVSVDRLKALVAQFDLPQGRIVPRGFGRNPDVDRFDFQYSQEIPSPIRGNSLLFTVDVANIGNLINEDWGVVKEFSNSRSGGAVVNAQCATASGVAAGNASPVCAAYRYSYTTVSPTTLATPTVDQQASLWSVVLGLKYRF
ncbi:TonB-dependent receptor [Brevundimonas variabilis]|uniref:TonB-dependent transporter Oar-like beta-barrel domain-containing protein n=1 Tax=Brevundimonas variabilis TaxID=74312 RepID=A0A7W9CKM2_9CAUL|nr:carboxypeptidase regulatory-like domain-containing protein [Brevundimonas variabilis]MBB5747168.1 hypothetical protein [Brevundimonas variabilis]